jgi:hypothetical protein
LRQASRRPARESRFRLAELPVSPERALMDPLAVLR